MEIKLYSNGDSSVSTFSTSLFQFGDYELSYLHAQVKVCFLEHETCPTKVKIVNFDWEWWILDRKSAVFHLKLSISIKNGHFRSQNHSVFDEKLSSSIKNGEF